MAVDEIDLPNGLINPKIEFKVFLRIKALHLVPQSNVIFFAIEVSKLHKSCDYLF